MNILFCLRYFPVYGGGETVTITLANEFVNRNHNVHIVYCYENIKENLPFIDPNIKTFKVDNLIDLFTMKDVINLRNIIVDNNIDIIINQWASPNICFEANRGTNTKIITCRHTNVIRETAIKGYGLKSIVKRVFYSQFQKYMFNKQIKEHDEICEKSDKYVFLSSSFVNEYKNISSYGFKSNNLIAIANPLTYRENVSSKILDDKKNEILFVGRFEEYPKRITRLLNIWEIINNTNKFERWKLILVGEGPDFELIKQISKKKNLRNISFEGFQSPMKYYKRASIFTMTSAIEGFPMALVEAQQNGAVPIAMNSYSSLHDIITSNENGVIVEDGNIQQYSEKLMELMSNRDKREQLAIKALDSCKKFSIDNIANQWENLFRSMEAK